MEHNGQQKDLTEISIEENPGPRPPARKPHLLFIHGAGSNADFWHEQHSAFPGAHYLNLPGHYSVLPGSNLPSSPLLSPLSSPYSIEDYADWVAEYVLDNALTRVVPVGHSMGGGIALALALRKPAWLGGLVLTGTGARLRISPRLLELLRTDYPAAVEMIVRDSLPPLMEPLTYKDKIRLNGLRRHFSRASQAVTLADCEACDSFDVMDRVSEINVPTLCIVGAQDSMTPPKYSEYLHSRIEGSHLEIIEGAGHMLPLEKSEAYNGHLRTLLEEIA